MNMTTKSLLIAALVVICSSASAIAKEEPTKAGFAIVPVKGSETFKIVYKSENTGSTKVNVYNADSKVIFSKVVSNTGGFILPLNFNGLEYGEYTIELTDATGTKTEKVVFQTAVKSSLSGNAKPSATSSLNVHIAKLSGEGKFLVAVANTSNEVVTIKIYDNANNLVYNETKALSGDFAQVFALKNISSSFTFEVSDKTGNLKSVTF